MPDRSEMIAWIRGELVGPTRWLTDAEVIEFTNGEFVDTLDDFEVTSPDVRHPSTVGISFCVQLDGDGHIVVRIPQSRRFSWQSESAVPSPVNGRYERCKR